jgi:hypothetical protein
VKEKFAAIRLVVEKLLKEIEDPQARKMLRYMLMAIAGLQIWIQYFGL